MPRFAVQLIACLLTFLLFSSVCPAQPEYSPLAGEIRFDGVVLSSVGTTLNINVESFTLPNGKSSKLPTPKPKAVLLEGATIVLNDDGPAATQPADALIAGRRIVVVGRDVGSGKDVPARVVVVTIPGEAGPAVASQRPAITGLPPIRADETRYDGKITGVLSSTTFTASIVSTTNNRSQTVELPEALERTVQITPETILRLRENPDKLLSIADLKVGLRVTFSGKAAGTKTINAREIAVWDDEEGKRRSLGAVTVSAAVSALLGKGDEMQRARSYENAARIYNQALQAAMNADDAPGQGLTYGRLALTYDDMGQPQRALESYQKSIDIWRRVGNTNSEALAHLNLSGHYLSNNNLKSARETVENAIRLFGGGNTRALAIAYSRFGSILARQEEDEKAIEAWQQALILSRQAQERDEEITVLGALAVSYAHMKQPERAKEVIEQLVVLIPQIADKGEQAGYYYRIGHAYRGMDNRDLAREYFSRAKTLWIEAGQRDGADAAEKQLKELENAAEPPAQDKPILNGIVPA